MIIDKILDRKDGANIVPLRRQNGKVLVTSEYNAKRFYDSVMEYGEIGFAIAEAMDSGTEQDVKRMLCEYVESNGYNTSICGYVNSVEWI